MGNIFLSISMTSNYLLCAGHNGCCFVEYISYRPLVQWDPDLKFPLPNALLSENPPAYNPVTSGAPNSDLYLHASEKFPQSVWVSSPYTAICKLLPKTKRVIMGLAFFIFSQALQFNSVLSFFQHL